MYEDLRNAVEVLKEYCSQHTAWCCVCPLYRVVCYNAGSPAAYSLERFDENVKELEDD